MEIIFKAKLSDLKHELELFDYNFESYPASSLYGYAYSDHGDHVHFYVLYDGFDVSKFDKWVKYCSQNNKYEVFAYMH